MKKTLIALALAATAASGSAMAWTPNGLGGSDIEFGGTLTPKNVVNPWEVKVGPNVDTLNSLLKPNEEVVNITVSNAVPLLGIRTTSSDAFHGGHFIAPQIDFKGAVDVNSSGVPGLADLTLDVVSTTDSSLLGKLTSSIAVGAVAAAANPDQNATVFSVFAEGMGRGFFGGVGNSSDKVISDADQNIIHIQNVANSLGVRDHFTKITTESVNLSPQSVAFNNPKTQYSAFYGAGLKSGDTVTINLTSPARTDMAWKASFPITVSYQ
ncbi:fimbrial protein [Salmonella enterica]|nr:fimbrial protein [Salmonella enterica]EGM3389990.1 fimbrial protein [Salmonella enterica]EHE3387888.1 fimbrial protein [Salmonella enterica]